MQFQCFKPKSSSLLIINVTIIYWLDKKPGKAISIDHFDLIRVIGRGSYAKVLMVELKETRRLYAMKVIKKELVTDDEVCSFDKEVISYIV